MKKKKALKALLWLAVVVAACMYFARTVQSITTPKVQLVNASTGRVEQKISVSAQAYFPVKTEITLDRAKEYPITVEKLYVKPGLYVQEGDVIFTASVNEAQSKQEELLKTYNEKSQALIDLDIKNRKSSKQSMQNDLYALMIEKQEAYNKAAMDARLAAEREGLTLEGDVSVWQAKAEHVDASPATRGLVNAAVTAKQAYDTAREDFFATYENRKVKVDDEVFAYINEREQLIKDMDELTEQMTQLQAAQQSLNTVTATSAGYIVAMDVKEGEAYDGSRSAYTIAKADDMPVLRADITDIRKDVEEGARVEAAGDYGSYKSTVTAVLDETDGRRYAQIELTDEFLRSAGGMTRLLSEGMQVSLVFRSRQNATLIPASALRSEGDGEFVYVAQREYGGLLSSGGYVAKKTPVTVIDRGETVVSIQEDLNYQSIIDQADRAVEDGKPVMEYVD